MEIMKENGKTYTLEEKDIRRGELYWVWGEQRNEQTKEIKKFSRPGIIVSNDAINKKNKDVEVIFLTNNPKDDQPTHVTIRSTGLTSTALCERIQTVDKRKIGNYIGTATDDELRMVERCMGISLGIDFSAIAPKTAQEAPVEKPREQDQDGYEAACLEEIARLKEEIEQLNEILSTVTAERDWTRAELKKAEQREREANAKLVMVNEALDEARAEANKAKGREELLKEMYNDLMRQTIR